MPRIADLRKQIRNDYLKNDVISGAEAKELVDKVKGDKLSSAGKAQLQKLRTEFKDKFSDAGLREFDKAVARASSSLPSTGGGSRPSGTGSPMDVRLGRTLPSADPVRLSAVADPDVRRALRRLDFNNDGQVNSRDRDKMGFSDDQWRSFVFMAALMGQKIDSSLSTIPADLSGKKVAFTAVPDKAKAAEWAKAMGAEVVSDLGPDLDFLIVGAAGGTGKDERAQALNALGAANITVADYESFSRKATEVGVTGPAPSGLSPAELSSAINELVTDWYKGHIEEHYDYELANTSDPDERKNILEDRQVDLDAGADHEVVELKDATWFEHVDDGEYTDRLGRPLNRDDLVEVQVSFFPEYAGIGLGTHILVDKRTGDEVDQGDIVD